MYGLMGPIYSLPTSYLAKRQQFAVNDSKGSSTQEKNGVPQGSVLGYLLFLIYINVLITVAKNNAILLFADYSNIYGKFALRKYNEDHRLTAEKWSLTN